MWWNLPHRRRIERVSVCTTTYLSTSFMGSFSILDGLVQRQQSTVETTSTNMRSALQDLEALMTQAGAMVALAESFNRSLMEHEATRQQLPEDAQFIIGSSMA